MNQGNKHIYIITGDSGNGLTHGVLGGKLIADQINGIDNPWTKLYNPKRLMSIASSLPGMVAHDVQINAQYKRFLESDIHDIEDLARGAGGVLVSLTRTYFSSLRFPLHPMAYYRVVQSFMIHPTRSANTRVGTESEYDVFFILCSDASCQKTSASGRSQNINGNA